MATATRKQAATGKRSRDVQSSLTKATPETPVADGGLNVTATAKGFYAGTRQRVGDVFTLFKASDFSRKWMTREHPGAPAAEAAAPTETATRDVLGE
jgi:hypothetical protein